MEDISRNVVSLRSIGLTENEAKIYVCMARTGLETAGQISRASGIRREMVYRALEKLERAGYVYRLLGTPMQFRAVQPSKISARLIKEQTARNARLVESIKKLKDLPGDDNYKNTPEDSFIWTSQPAAIVDINRFFFIECAKYGIDLVFSRKKLAKYLLIHKNELRNAISRGVRMRFITERGPHGVAYIEKRLSSVCLGESSELRYADKLSSHFGIADDKYVSISTNIEVGLAEKPIITSFNKPMIAVYRMVFDEMWLKAKQVR